MFYIVTKHIVTITGNSYVSSLYLVIVYSSSISKNNHLTMYRYVTRKHNKVFKSVVV